MLLSRYFLPTLKEIPSEASIVSHQLMLRAGMIRQITSGIYSWLPFGDSFLKKVENIVREEMNSSGALEVTMPIMQPSFLWQQSGRYKDGGDIAQQTAIFEDKNGNELIFSPTAEEIISSIFSNNAQSYKDLPKNIYQIQWKFRDEIRPRYGVLRCREFLMKDSYSFDLNREDALRTYDKMLQTYLKIYKRMGLIAIPVVAGSGAIGGDYSHELHVLADTGESSIYYDIKIIDALSKDGFNLESLGNFYANEEEKHDHNKIFETELCVSKSIEVGHLFYIGQKYSESMNVKLNSADGGTICPEMGCYGIGISRLAGAIIEVNNDERGIILPYNLSPFLFCIINLKVGDEYCDKLSSEVYDKLQESNLSVLYDDTNNSPGVKFANMDLIGIPLQIIIGPNNATKNIIELKERRSGMIIDGINDINGVMKYLSGLNII